MGVVTILASTSMVAATLHTLHTTMRDTWSPGAYLRHLVILPTSNTINLSASPSLSSIYLSSVVYLLGGEGVTLHHIHPFTGAVRPGHLFPDPLQDMGGAPLRAVALEFQPFMTITREDGRVGAGDSVDWRMATTIANILNFTIELTEPEDCQWGNLKNGTWNGVVSRPGPCQ